MSNIQSLPLRSWISIYGQEGNYWNFVKETDYQKVSQECEKYRDLYFSMRDLDSVCVEKVEKLEAENKQLSITEAGLREFLTGLSRESNEYRYKIETENAVLLADKARLDWLEANHYLVDFIDEGVEPTQKGVFICTDGSNSQTATTIRAAIDAAIKNNL